MPAAIGCVGIWMTPGFNLVLLAAGLQSTPSEPYEAASNRAIVCVFYQKAFMESDRSYAAAIAFMLLVVIVILTAVQFRLQRGWVLDG